VHKIPVILSNTSRHLGQSLKTRSPENNNSSGKNIYLKIFRAPLNQDYSREISPNLCRKTRFLYREVGKKCRRKRLK
jgi:hypothetical protein